MSRTYETSSVVTRSGQWDGRRRRCGHPIVGREAAERHGEDSSQVVLVSNGVAGWRGVRRPRSRRRSVCLAAWTTAAAASASRSRNLHCGIICGNATTGPVVAVPGRGCNNVLVKAQRHSAAVHLAAQVRHEREAATIAAHIASSDVNAVIDEDEETTPLISAATAGDVTSVNMLLAIDGIDVNAMGCGWSSLHHAAAGGYLEVIAALLHAGADVDCVEGPDETYTALMAAVINNQPLAVAALLAAGADANIGYEDCGGTPFDAASGEMAELLRPHTRRARRTRARHV